jgi:hypothetical protein
MTTYQITVTNSSGTTNVVKGHTPLSALRALKAHTEAAKLRDFVNASRRNNDGTLTMGVIQRDGAAAYFSDDN